MKKLALSVLISSLLATNAFANDNTEVASSSDHLGATVQSEQTGNNQQLTEAELAEMQKKLNNPLADLWLLFTQNDYTSFKAADGNDYTMNSFKFQPVMSFDMTENYNLILRPTLQHSSIEAPGMDRESGLGDSGVLAALGPKTDINGWIIGGGVTSMFPTAKEESMTLMGADQTAVGPALIALNIGEVNTYGAVIQHFSGIGSSNNVDEHGKEEDINLTDIQYVYRHKIGPATQIGFAPNIQVDWNKEGSDRFSIPVGIGIDTITKIGKLPVRLGIEAYHYIEQNDQFGPDYGIRIFAIPVVPKLF
ncbi:hypothetical protein [Thalassotalea atypica]|uniref:hypothetical protein n=1 Tax=Thalassotalea atypica TaxID=2054316 RepID=UPI0025723FCE|nr:hypothetical protein [Thalassotalea atypica]